MTRKGIISIVITSILLIAAVIIIVAVVVSNRSDDYRVKRLMDGSVLSVNDLKNSRLSLEDNGTFSIEVVKYENDTVFAGIGTYTVSGSTYTFYFVDAQTTRNGVNTPDPLYVFKTHTYQVDGRTKWIVFIDHLGDPYYFGR